MTTSFRTTPALLILLAGLAWPAWARHGGEHECQHGKAEMARLQWLANPIDPATGRDARNFARSTGGIDYRHMKLELTVLDMNTPVMNARQTLTLAPLGRAVSTISLDARLLTIDRAESPGRTVTHEHDGQTLTMTFTPPLPADEAADVVIHYTIQDPPRGLFWTPESPAWPGRPAQIHTQGQPETNSYWFPCHDFPNERLTTELVVAAPTGFTVSSNGRFVGKEQIILDLPDGVGGSRLAGFDQWRFLQDKPHVNYLVTLVIGKFDIVELGTPSLPMPVYVPPGRADDARTTYGRTPEMVRLFEQKLDEPYPWDRYAQLVVHNFVAGGMENTAATTMHDTALLTPASADDFDLDGLISHELAHQWFGDLMTCNTWEHIWLNEGWATFLTPVWFEHRDGRAAYEARVRELYDGVIASDTGMLPTTPGMASKVYSDAWEPFRRSANPYGKGASVLAMLRARLGDEAFWRGVRLYVDRHKFKNVETSDFRQALEDGSGDSLELFFTQWVTRPNIPRLAIEASWDDATRTLKLSGQQTQTIDGLNPAFQFNLPVWIKPKGVSDWTKATLTFDGKSGELGAIPLDAEPEAIAFDPELTVIAEIRCSHPAASSLALLTEGPTLNARVQAMRGIGEDAPDSVLKALSDVASDRSLNAFLRVEAVRALARAKSAADLSVLLTSATDSWRVREAVVSALADLSRSDSATATMRERSFVMFSKLAESDKSTRVRAAAIRGLGAMNAGGAIELLMRTSRAESQDDAVRIASIDALVALNRKSCLAIVGELTKPGRLSRTRAAAIRAVASLAAHDPDLAFELVSANLADREWRSRQAAGESLVQLKDPRGVDALSLRRKDVADPYEQALIDRWTSDLRAAIAPQQQTR